MNKEVSFDLAKLVSEKEFDKIEGIYKFYVKPNSKMFGIDEKGRTYPIKNIAKKLYTISEYATLNSKNVYLAPTIAEVVMWLYEKYNIWISVTTCITGSDEWDYGYIITYLPKEFENVKRRATYLITKESFKESTGSYTGAWHLPTEAYEKAIEHALKKLT